MLKPVAPALALRLLGYTLVLSWLVLDLFVWQGPLHRRLAGPPPDAAGLDLGGDLKPAAVVYGRVVTLREVDQRVAVDRMRGGRGGDLTALHTGELRELREVALDKIILEDTIDAKVRAREENAAPEEAREVIERAERDLGGAEQVAGRLRAAGLSREAWEELLVAEHERLAYLERLIDGPAREAVDDLVVMEWFENHKELFVSAPRIKARHWFRVSLRRDADELRADVFETYRALVAGEISFDEACLESSDDYATRENGGSLGWIARDANRLPEGLDSDDLFAVETGLREPMESNLGWHIFYVEESDLNPQPVFEDHRDDIRAHLVSEAREDVRRQIFRALREEAITTLYRETLDQAPTPPTLPSH